jgi:Peptidase of plants and bacteria
MHKRLLACLLLVSLSLAALPQGSAADKDKPREKPKPAPVKVAVTVDTSEVPEVAEWARKAKELCEKWHPLVADLLKSDGFTPRGEVRIVFKKNMKGVAYASGRTITIAAAWIKKHPDDYGMVVHELTHTIQGYQRGPRPSWLVEGIADYVRFFHYEPKTKVIVNPKRASYRNGYRTTAAFLAWIEKAHDKDIVRKLNAALRQGTYKDELFKTHTTKTVDELWALYVASLERAK